MSDDSAPTIMRLIRERDEARQERDALRAGTEGHSRICGPLADEVERLREFVRAYDATSVVIRSDYSTAEAGIAAREVIDAARAALGDTPYA